MGMVQTKNPQMWEENEYFMEKDNLNYMCIKNQPMKHSYYKIIFFQHFPLDQ